MLNFALIGCGDIAVTHARQINQHGVLSAVCDIVPRKAAEFAKQYNAKAFHSIDEMLAGAPQAEVVVICTPNGLHAEHVIKSLQAGKHVICESPLCLTGAAAWQIMETRKFSRKQLIVVANENGWNDVKEKATVNADINRFELTVSSPHNNDPEKEWMYKEFPGGGALYTPFQHAVELLSTLFGPVESGRTSLETNGNVETEHAGVSVITMQNGIEGRLTWSMTNGKPFESVLTVHHAKGQEVIKVPVGLENAQEEVYKKIYDNLDAQIKGNESVQTAFKALRAVEMTEKIYRSAYPLYSTN